MNSRNSNKKEDPKAKRIISARLLNHKIKLAKKALTEAGLISIDGSGNPIFEDIFALLKLFSDNQLEVKRR